MDHGVPELDDGGAVGDRSATSPSMSRGGTDLSEGPVGPLLARLTGPMVVGLISIFLFNLVDTYFVSLLGTEELAAMSFTFPVAILIGSLTLGLGVGTTSAIARTIGSGDRDLVRSLTTHSLIFSLLIVAVISLVGLLTIDPLFTLLGATDRTLPLVRAYMVIWYAGTPFVVIPMVGNAALRALGDTRTPAWIMFGASLLNMALDPLLIFGLGPIPAMEIEGAAIATVIARTITLALTLTVLHYRESMITWTIPSARAFWDSIREVLTVGIPAAATNTLRPISIAALTALVALYGEEAVAAFGAGARVGAVALMAPIGLSIALAPFVGQNWGAGFIGRVVHALRLSHRFSFAYGVVIWGVSALLCGPIAGLFSEDPKVLEPLESYLVIVPIAYGMQGVFLATTSAYNAAREPLTSAVLSIVRTLALYVPLALVGSIWFGLTGIFAGMAIAESISGVIAFVVARRLPERFRRKFRNVIDAQP